MSRRRRPSAQTRTILELLSTDPDRWFHGYELSQKTGIASGTLYPLMMRLTDRGYLESKWEQASVAGRPPRHLYRLTATGRQYAAQAAHGTARRYAPWPVSDGA